MATTKDLNQVNEKDRHLRQNLTSMEQELKDLNATLASHRRQVEDYLSGGFAGTERIKPILTIALLLL